jgi:hypothetical protein
VRDDGTASNTCVLQLCALRTFFFSLFLERVPECMTLRVRRTYPPTLETTRSALLKHDQHTCAHVYTRTLTPSQVAFTEIFGPVIPHPMSTRPSLAGGKVLLLEHRPPLKVMHNYCSTCASCCVTFVRSFVHFFPHATRMLVQQPMPKTPSSLSGIPTYLASSPAFCLRKLHRQRCKDHRVRTGSSTDATAHHAATLRLPLTRLPSLTQVVLHTHWPT